MLGEELLKYFSRDSSILLFVIYDTFIKIHGSEHVHVHEEADTLIPHQVLASVANGTMQEIYFWSPDTDVLLLLLGKVQGNEKSMCLSTFKPLDIENVKASLGFTIFLVLTGEESWNHQKNMGQCQTEIR